MTPCEENLIALLGGLNIRAVEGVVLLDREAPVRHMASATLRGLAGHALRRHAPEMVARWFKPGACGDKPPAYVFQPLNRRVENTRHFLFRIVTWDPPGELISALCRALDVMRSAPFGETGTHVVGLEWSDGQRLEFSGELQAAPAQRVLLHTPLRCRIKDQWADEHSLSLETLVRTTATRLNGLSRSYGNGTYLQARPFLEAVPGVGEMARNLRLVHPHRRSSTQMQNIDLTGLVGTIDYGEMPSSLMNLLFCAGVFHIGKHTAEGCGHVLLVQSPAKQA